MLAQLVEDWHCPDSELGRLVAERAAGGASRLMLSRLASAAAASTSRQDAPPVLCTSGTTAGLMENDDTRAESLGRTDVKRLHPGVWVASVLAAGDGFRQSCSRRSGLGRKGCLGEGRFCCRHVEPNQPDPAGDPRAAALPTGLAAR